MRIFIYVENEEMMALKPLRDRLSKKGAQVSFYALKFLDNDVRADLILTLPQHLKTVEELFARKSIPIRVIEDDGDPSTDLAPLAASKSSEPVMPLTIEFPPEEEKVVEIILPEVKPTTEVVEMFVAEAEPDLIVVVEAEPELVVPAEPKASSTPKLNPRSRKT